ncbi:MAG: transposase [Acidimicrobiales bacterium]
MSREGCRTFSFRLYPTVGQQIALTHLFDLQRELYNAALEARRGAWAWEKRSTSHFDECKVLTDLRDVRPDVLSFGVIVCRGTLKRLDRAFSAFYRRCAKGEKPGYPRFRSLSRFDSVQYEDRSGWRLDEEASRLHLQGIGAVKVRLHRPARGIPKAITVRREGRHWLVAIRSVEVPKNPLPSTGKQIGIDLGVGVLVGTSDGKLVKSGRFLKQEEACLKEAQQVVSRRHHGSKGRQRAVQEVGAIHRKVARRRKDLLHKASRALVDDYDLICHEALKVSKMTRRPKPRRDEKGGYERNGARAKSGLNKSINDSGWNMLLTMIAYKAEDAGRQMIAVDPRNTSRKCAKCGYVDKHNRRGVRFSCLSCGHEAHADLNAAVNILRAGRAQQLRAA